MGAIQAEQIARRHLIPMAEIERYARRCRAHRGGRSASSPTMSPTRSSASTLGTYAHVLLAQHVEVEAKVGAVLVAPPLLRPSARDMAVTLSLA